MPGGSAEFEASGRNAEGMDPITGVPLKTTRGKVRLLRGSMDSPALCAGGPVRAGTRPVRLNGTENRHKAIQKSRAEIRFPSGSGPTFITASQSAKSCPLSGTAQATRSTQSCGARSFKGFSLAKYLCGSSNFSNMFCEAFGCPRAAGMSRTSDGGLAGKRATSPSADQRKCAPINLSSPRIC